MAHRYSKPIFPGALTPTEVLTAWEAGADVVKVFPCGNMGGPKYIKALKGPFPQIEMAPTGGEATASRVRAESEKLLRRASDQFGDVKLAGGGTVGDKVRLELDDNLVVGKVPPEIEGQDQDGKTFKLSDYKGKVVLLDFWHQY